MQWLKTSVMNMSSFVFRSAHVALSSMGAGLAILCEMSRLIVCAIDERSLHQQLLPHKVYVAAFATSCRGRHGGKQLSGQVWCVLAGP